MRAAQTFLNIAQLTIMKLGIPQPPHSPIAAVASAWSGNDQLCLESAEYPWLLGSSEFT